MSQFIDFPTLTTYSVQVSANALAGYIVTAFSGCTVLINDAAVVLPHTLLTGQTFRVTHTANADIASNVRMIIPPEPGSTVASVNGQTGAVVLTAASVGAAPASALAAKADLIGGFLPTSQLPAIAIGELFSVASQAAMLALTAQQGDVAVRTDLANKRFLLLGASATLASWKSIDDVGAGGVTTVNGQSGVVVLAAADVGALPTSQKGAASGLASLGADGILLPAQRPPSSGGAAALSSNTTTPAEQPDVGAATAVAGGTAYDIRYNVLAAVSFVSLQMNVIELGGSGDTLLLEVHRTDSTYTTSAGTKLTQGTAPITPSYVLTTVGLLAPATFAAGEFLVLKLRGQNSGYPRLDATASVPLPTVLPLGKLAYNGIVGTNLNVGGTPRITFFTGVSKSVIGPLDAVDFPVVTALANLAVNAAAIFDPGTAPPRLVRKRADGTVWYGTPFTSVP